MSPITIDRITGDLVTISKKEYQIAPNITEYEYITNNSDLSKQQVGHILEVKVGADSSASLIAGYNDYNIEAIKSGSNWGMKKPTEQSEAAETRHGVNVVGVVNADFFNMSNGCPSGVLVMNGTAIKGGSSACFWIDSSNEAHISANGTAMNAEAAALGVTVQEAIGGGVVLVDGGERTSVGGDYGDTTNPRTVVGLKADGTVIIYMVDGRQAPYSVGMTYGDLADIMLELDCVDAINLDGGGSSMFATQREGEEDNSIAGLTVRNSPSDGYERSVSSSLMVISNAQYTGVFDHAVLAPYEEVYTPGSTVQFTASGVDAAGGPAELPASGLSWAASAGTIDENGLFTAAKDFTGTVTVKLSYDGAVVGTTSIDVQWPDALAFTNTSVSLDFGQSSDLTFNPTYQGREVNYKDGDFKWSLAPTYYKFDALVDPKTNNTKGDFSMAITPDILNKDVVVVEYYAWGSSLTYTSTYKVTELTQATETDGTETITAKVVYVSSGGAAGEKVPANLEQTFTSGIGQFTNNTFVADEEASLKGTVSVALANDDSVTGSIDVVVGMEPYVLMDFEDHTDSDGTVTGAEEYWTYHADSSSTGSDGQLTVDEVHANRLWFRDTTNKGVVFTDKTGLISAEEDSNVRFGQYAFRLGYDFTQIDPTEVAVGDFGFSGDLLVDTIQPTKIGMWINVPKDCAEDHSVLKAVLKGAAYEGALATSYMILNNDGTMTYKDGYQLTGTAAYVQYYSYNSDGTVSGSMLSDWAGKGWTWVEADISAYQMPLDVCRGYTVRITSAQNVTKKAGYLYIDNLQFIYGTNTNDINNPVIESITEKTSGTTLSEGAVTELTDNVLNFEILYADSELTDKYATGIDTSSIRVYVDGIDCTGDVEEISAKNLYLTGVELTNGTHTIKAVVKDFYGNQTTASRTFKVNAENGKEAIVSVVPQEEPAVIGGTYALNIVNGDPLESITSADVTIELPSAYAESYTVTAGAGFVVTESIKNDQVTIHITPDEIVTTTNGVTLATLMVHIPEDAQQGDTFKYSVPMGAYETAAGDAATFSETEKSVALTASYEISASQAIVGLPTEFTVVDTNGDAVSGAEVYSGDALIGTTDENGKVSYTYPADGRVTIYAKTESGRSWNADIVVSAKASENGGYPIGIQNNGTIDPDTNQSITWLADIDSSDAKAIVRYSTDETMTADVKEAEGASELLTFAETSSGTALRANRVLLAGLTPGTTYYYQAGDGKKWSDTCTFTTASSESGATNFFVLGDIQTEDTANLAAAITKLGESSYDFGIQTGDAIDGVNDYSQWRAFFTEINSAKLNGVDLIHTLGNHEYYGDINGEVSDAIYDLPESTQGSWYAMEYGNVCVVVVNHGGSLTEAVQDVAENLDTDCTWKVLVTHEPIYGTTETMADATRLAVTAAIEEAGFDFVFGGDHHAYARTYPMIGDAAQNESSRDGVVYYISGDLSSKTNAFTKQDCHVVAIPHVDYTGMYITAEVTDTYMTIKAYDYLGNLLDSYTETRTDCELGEHTYDSTSIYDTADKTITCSVCGEKAAAADTNYTGMLSTTTEGAKVILAAGVVKTGWITWGEVTYHAGDDGILHETTTRDTRTCTTNGYIVTTCATCNVETRSEALWAEGHKWDEDHVCTVCDTVGINMADVTLNIPYQYYNYSGKAIYPQSSATYNGAALSASSSRTGKDAYISYLNNVEVGTGTIVYEGRGDYYGEISGTFNILPQSVSTITASTVTQDSVTLSWTAAPGAQEYLVQQLKNGYWKTLAIITDTSYTVTGLAEDTEYSFRVYDRTNVDGTYFYCSKYSSALLVNTAIESESLTSTYLTGVSAIVDGQTIGRQTVDRDHYIFLPASADLKALQLKFTVSGCTDAITLTGGKGSVTLDTYDQAVDLTAIAEAADGVYTLNVALGDRIPAVVQLMHSGNVNTIYLTSDDPAAAGRAYVDAAKGNSATARMLMVDESGAVIYDGALGQVKSRGNSTFRYFEKKSYQIKLDSKTDLLGNGEKVKTWVLLAGYSDATQMHDKLFKDLAAELGMEGSASCDWADLYYDGEYRGTYLLSEKNSIDGNSVDITDMEKAYEEVNDAYGDDMNTAEKTNAYGKTYQYTTGLVEPEDTTGGYLLELNHDYLDEASGFFTKQGVAFNVKSPEWCGDEAMAYISEYYQAFEDAVYATDESGNYTGYNEETGKYYYEYCDLTSLVQTYLLQQLSLNIDAYASSFYFYKDADGMMYAGPVWDMESTCGTGWSQEITADWEFVDLRYLAKALSKIPSFQEAVQAYYNDTFKAAAEELFGADGKIAAYEETLADSAAMNYTIWPLVKMGDPSSEKHLWEDGTTYADVVEKLNSWLETRLDLMSVKNPEPTPEEPDDPVTTPDVPTTPSTSGGDHTVTYPICIVGPNGTMDSSIEIVDGQLVIQGSTDELYVPEKENWTYNGWTFTAEKNGQVITIGTFKTITDELTEALLAKVEEGWNLTMDSVTPGVTAYKVTVTDGSGDGAYAAGETVTIKADAKSGYTFKEWVVVSGGVTLTDKAAEETSFIMGESEVVIQAAYTKDSSSGGGGGGGGGGGASSTYTNTVEKTEHGKIEVSPKRAYEGDTVTITVTPETGYELDKLIVKDADGNEIKVSGGNGEYTFEMPDNTVTIQGTFVEKAAEEEKLPFTDVDEDDYFEDAVRWAVSSGVTTGATATTFAPNVTCTRAQIVTFLWRAAGSPAPKSAEMPFVDVSADDYYYKAVLWASENGITTGTTATTFAPNATVTRAQSVTFLWRNAGKPSGTPNNPFTDVNEGAYYADAVLWAVKDGITNGMTATTFAPDNGCTRAQIVTFLYRYYAD